jgi:hypothetical protein
MPYAICRHIMTTGIQCQSPALLGHRFCFYHVRQAANHQNMRPNPKLDPFFEHGRHIRLSPLEDRQSVQMALSQTVSALAAGQIELKHARAVLYGLHLAAQNIKDLEAHPELLPNPVEMVQKVVASYDYLEIAPGEPTAALAELDEPDLLPAPHQCRSLDTTSPIPHYPDPPTNRPTAAPRLTP